MTTVGAGWLKQSSLGQTSTAGDRFGQSLAAGNVYDSDEEDLVVGEGQAGLAGGVESAEDHRLSQAGES